MQKKDDYEFTDGDFNAIADVVYDISGIVLNENKKSLVYSRLIRRIRELNITSFAEYIDFSKRDATEKNKLIDFITTNVTSFFREKHHFEILTNFANDKLSKNSEKLKIWCAGCSSGEEPYSIVMHLETTFNNALIFEILATDICDEILGLATKGVYAEKSIENINADLVKKYFLRGKSSNSGKVKIDPIVKKKITFGKVNLMEPITFHEDFDVIFCRNVIIYFDAETKLKLIRSYHRALKPNGILFLGHSEGVCGAQELYTSLGHTAYRKKEQ